MTAEERLNVFSNKDYVAWREYIFDTIEQAKLTASLKVNETLLSLYNTIGSEIIQKQEIEGWGTQVVKRLSDDLQKRYPGESGFSERNLRNMKIFAKEYPDFPIVQVSLAQLEKEKATSIWQAALAKINEKELVQVPLAQIPWHHQFVTYGWHFKENIAR